MSSTFFSLPKPGAVCEVHVSRAMQAVTLLVVLLPMVGLAAAIWLLWGVEFNWEYLMLMGGMYLLSALGIGVGYHRLFTHKSFETSAAMRFFWAVLGSVALEGPVIRWVAVHRKHHQHSDSPEDPHSPHAEGPEAGLGGLLRGVWHSHIGWLFAPEPTDLHRYAPDLEQDRVVRFVSDTFLVWVILGFLLPAALGGILVGTWHGVLLGFLWGGLVRVLLVHHVTWSINSVCHLWGTRPFRTGDESRDNPVFGFLALGEGWHNAHHAFPTSARHGLAWWKLDINYLVIRGMELLHLARNVRRPTLERLAERRRCAE